jgi:glutaredoxin 3
MTDSTGKASLAEQLTTRVKSALDRADELGGDLRDFLQDRWANDPRLASVRARVDKLRGKEPAAPVTPVSVNSAPPPGVAPMGPAVGTTAPAAAAAAAPKGLGNPGLPAQIYGKESCPWTGRARTVLERAKVDFDYIDLEQQEHEKFLPLLATETHQNTVPYVYLRGQFIGGYNALAEIERLGQLEVAMMSAEERAKAPAHLRMIEVVARPNTDEVAPAETAEAPAGAGD